jgi:hypothetical protein
VVATQISPATVRLVRSFQRNGCVVHTLVRRSHWLARLDGIASTHFFRSFDPVKDLLAAIRATAPTLLLPADDLAVWLLHEAAARDASALKLVETSLGPKSRFETVRRRIDQMVMAAGLGVATPGQAEARDAVGLQRWMADNPGPCVLKADASLGGNGVRVAHDAQSALAALAELQVQPGLVRRWKRWLVNADPVSHWAWSSRFRPTVMVQRFIPGEQANCMVACHRGKVAGIVTARVVACRQEFGASTILDLVDNAPVRDACERIAFGLRSNGFIGLDFVIDQATGQWYLIEINARPTQLGHFNLDGSGDLVHKFLLATGHRPLVRTSPGALPSRRIALWPQLPPHGAASEHLAGSYLDRPRDDPMLDALVGGPTR